MGLRSWFCEGKGGAIRPLFLVVLKTTEKKRKGVRLPPPQMQAGCRFMKKVWGSIWINLGVNLDKFGGQFGFLDNSTFPPPTLPQERMPAVIRLFITPLNSFRDSFFAAPNPNKSKIVCSLNVCPGC